MPSKRGALLGPKNSRSKKRKPMKAQRKGMTIPNDVMDSEILTVKSLHLDDTSEQTAEDAGIGIPPKQETKGELSLPKADGELKKPLAGGKRKVYRICVTHCPSNEDDALEFYIAMMKDVMRREDALKALTRNNYEWDCFYASLTRKELRDLLDSPEGNKHIYTAFVEDDTPRRYDLDN